MTFEEWFEDGLPVEEVETLYLIIGVDMCRKLKHEVHNINLLIPFPNCTVKAKGQYCATCKQAQIDRNTQAGLRQKYGAPLCPTFLKGYDDIVWFEKEPLAYPYDRDHNGDEHKERAEESKLKKLGYSVAAEANLSNVQRQALLKSAIENGQVSRGYVESYLRHMIQINGKKDSNNRAVQKWKMDLEYIEKLPR